MLPSSSPSSPPSHALESLLSLQSFFLPFISDIASSKSPSPSSDPLSVYRSWLRSNFYLFLNSRIDIVASPHSDDAHKEVALEGVMEIVKLGKGGSSQFPIYHKLLGKIVHSSSLVDTVVELLASNYLKYLDVRYFTYSSLEKLINNIEFTLATDNRNVKQHGDGEPMSASRKKKRAFSLGKGDKKTSHGILAEENEADK